MKTKDEMVKLGNCNTVICVTDCPFDQQQHLFNSYQSLPIRRKAIKTCYDIGVSEYKKEKEQQMEKERSRGLKVDSIIVDEMTDEFTLKDITDAMISGKPIVCAKEPMYFDNGRWEWLYKHYHTRREDLPERPDPNFSKPYMWRYYKEPPKTVKKTFYRPVSIMEDGDICIDGFWYQKKGDPKVAITSDQRFLYWEEKEFEIQEED